MRARAVTVTLATLILVLAAVVGAKDLLQVSPDFKNIDANKDGAITMKELQAAAVKMGVKTSPSKTLFDQADKNKDGKLTQGEFALCAADLVGKRGQSVTVCGNKFWNVEMARPDPARSVAEAFEKSRHPNKMNLGVGVFRVENLQSHYLKVVKKAEKKVTASGYSGRNEYLPLEGLGAFRTASAKLLFGAGSPALAEGRVATLQALSGTGSLRVGADFIARWLPGRKVYLSNPTWVEYKTIFGDAGLKWELYRYVDPKSQSLNFKGMMADLEAAPQGSVVVLQGAAHNPTGIDPTLKQWRQIAEVCKRKQHIPFFDMAFQGFASGDLEKDAAAPRMFVQLGLPVMAAQSYSKNMGLYSERVGAINVVTPDADTTRRVMSQLRRIASGMWTAPPAYGARVAAEVMGSPAMFEEWKGEVKAMVGSITKVREELRAALKARMPAKDWSFVTKEVGMYSDTAMSPKQIAHMAKKHGVFMLPSGRINVAGLSSAQVVYLANAFVETLKNVK